MGLWVLTQAQLYMAWDSIITTMNSRDMTIPALRLFQSQYSA